MTRSIKDATIGIYEPGNHDFGNPDLEIPAEDIAVVDTSERLNDRKDTATIELHNDRGQYTSDTNIDIRSGQMIVFRVGTEGDIKFWGDKSWGSGAWGGQKLRWTGIIRDATFTYAGNEKSFIELKAEDFVFGVMSMRKAYNSWVDLPISGSNDAILDTVMENEVPEIDTSRIESFQDLTTVTADGTDVLEISIKLTKQSDAIMYASRDRLYFEDPENISPSFDLEGRDIGYFDMEYDDANIVNEVRVDGSQDSAVDDEQQTQTDYTTASEENRVTFQVSTRKSEISELEIWTNQNDNTETMNVRFQKDDNGSPVAPDDSNNDIANHSLDAEFISHDDFTTFLMPDHTLPEPNPWVIIETDGSEGHKVGVNNAGDPAFRAWYPYSVTVRQTEADSKRKYRLREHTVKDDSIGNAEEARGIATGKLNHDSIPEKEMTMPAESRRAHHVDIGEIINVDFPREKAEGQFIITERSDTYQGNKLETTLKAAEVQSI